MAQALIQGRGQKRGRPAEPTARAASSVLAGEQGRRRTALGKERLLNAGTAREKQWILRASEPCELSRFIETQLEPIAESAEDAILRGEDTSEWPDDGPAASWADVGKLPSSNRYRPVRQWIAVDDEINRALDKAAADGKRGKTTTGVRAWIAFCKDVIGTSPDRPLDPNAPLWMRLEEEWLAMRFVCALVTERGVRPKTAACYFSSVQGWHAREHGVKLAGGLKLARLPEMLKGLRRIHGDPERRLRRGISAPMLRRAMDKLLDPRDPTHANLRAALATALQGLLRAQEFCVRKGSQRGDKEVPQRRDVRELNDAYMELMLSPCKNMTNLSGKNCPVVIGAGGDYIDAVAEVKNLLEVDARAPGDAPLFRDPSTGKAIEYETVHKLTRRLMTAIGENPDEFGTHSYRIGGATALFAAGANETVIRTMGRWSSDIHRLYVRSCFENCCSWTRRAGSTKVSETSGVFDEVDDY